MFAVFYDKCYFIYIRYILRFLIPNEYPPILRTFFAILCGWFLIIVASL